MKTTINPDRDVMSDLTDIFTELVSTVRELRGPDGCPWDKRQDTVSLKKYLHSEFKELIDAINNNDCDNICEELGDMLFLIVMVSEISREESKFDIHRVIDTINKKLIRRHPHVFEEKKKLSEEDLNKQWNAIKAAEKAKNII